MKKFILFLLFIIIVSFISGIVFLKNHKQGAFVEIKEYKLTTFPDKSMEPTIKENELIVIKQFPEYDLDDIVIYEDNSRKTYNSSNNSN